MDKLELLNMARQANQELVTEYYPGHSGELDVWTILLLEIFAKLVAEKEREACAKVCDEHGVHPALNVFNGGPDWYKHAISCAKEIRARGDE